MNSRTFLLVFSLFFFCSQTVIGVVEDKDLYRRPAGKILIDRVLAGFSFMPPSTRKEVSGVLHRIDQNHQEIADRIIRVEIDQGFKLFSPMPPEAFNYMTANLPDSERALMYLLNIQKEILVRLVMAKKPLLDISHIVNPSRKILKQDQRIFNNYADIYYAELILALYDISRLQQIILPGQTILTAPLEQAMKIKRADVESFVRGQFESVRENSQTINEHLK